MSDEKTRQELQPAGDLGEGDRTYQDIVGDVATMIAKARDSAARSVNAALTVEN